MRIKLAGPLAGVLAALSLLLAAPAAGADLYEFDMDDFARIPVLDQGRIKPLDSFARAYLEGFYGRDRLKEMSAVEWLAELLFDPERAYRRQVFNIADPRIVDALELEHREKHRYSYAELAQAFEGHFNIVHSIFARPEEERTRPQNNLLMLFSKAHVFAEISGSLSLVADDLVVGDPALAAELGVEPGKGLTYLDLQRHRDMLEERLEAFKAGGAGDGGHAAAMLAAQLRSRAQDEASQILRVVPPQWSDFGEEWFSPWSTLIRGQGSPKTAAFLNRWRSLRQAYRAGDMRAWSEHSAGALAESLAMAPEGLGKRLALELRFNRLKPFGKSLALYLAAFLLALASFLMRPAALRRAALILAGAGLALHAMGIGMRMAIMGRPPVTNLYESIIFVGFIAVVFGLILELRKGNRIGLLVAASVGVVLHFVGMRYDADGDTMGMLAAVLDTNFWLATHVVTITIGYGCCFVGGILGHIYMVHRLIKPGDRKTSIELFNNMRGVSFVALFFAALGTILGGIWADQSWGRFWGWDPKENGALLIVLWLVWLLHGRLCGYIKELEFAAGMICTNIIVALAWFGVNLLAVGLHSYGFTDSAAFNLALFCGIELLVAWGSYAAIRLRESGSAA